MSGPARKVTQVCRAARNVERLDTRRRRVARCNQLEGARGIGKRLNSCEGNRADVDIAETARIREVASRCPSPTMPVQTLCR